jgi:hypothetical protein
MIVASQIFAETISVIYNIQTNIFNKFYTITDQTETNDYDKIVIDDFAKQIILIFIDLYFKSYFSD